MFHFHRMVLLGLLTVASGALTVDAQTFDTSGNSVLNGAYFIREVMFTQIDGSGAIGQGQSAIGTATFDGKGNYTFNTGTLQASSYPLPTNLLGTRR
jgi:hypothetical protein